MPWLGLNNVSFGFGGPRLLENAELRIEPGDRLGLIGRNGAGKSTLIEVLRGAHEPEEGTVERSPGLRLGFLSQSVPDRMAGSVLANTAAGLPDHAALVAEYAALRDAPEALDSPRLLELEGELQETGGFSALRRVETAVSKLGLDGSADVATLSAGVKRRVLLARALVSEPDVLLLDEPTNHLDIASIEWLEGFLSATRAGLLFITHDRVFLERLATGIVELDRGRLRHWPANYSRYLEKKAEELEVEAQQNREFDKKLAEEEVWIRKGVKERRKRNMGRVRRLKEARSERSDRQDVQGSVRMVAQEAQRTGRLVIATKGLSFDYEGGADPEAKLATIRDLTVTISRGDRVGILGPNGCGKTTLLRLLLGELEPTEGTVRHGTNLEVAYFDQLHAGLDPQKSVADNVAQGNDFVEVAGQKRHVLGYLQDFLFPPLQARSLVDTLSGGERNRLLLARLFSKPSNVLVLDEPTNDLDSDTLELLEELLLEYSGTVLAVSHDRAFLNHVATSTLAFEGEGRFIEYVGGYDDWLRQRPPPPEEREREERKKEGRKARQAAKASDPDAPRKLTYKEERELEALPTKLEELEEKKAAILARMEDPEFYEEERTVIDRTAKELESLEAELAASYARWEELEARV